MMRMVITPEPADSNPSIKIGTHVTEVVLRATGPCRKTVADSIKRGR